MPLSNQEQAKECFSEVEPAKLGGSPGGVPELRLWIEVKPPVFSPGCAKPNLEHVLRQHRRPVALNELLETWRTLVFARAIENLVYTATVQNLYYEGERGIGIIAGPEEVLARSSDPGMLAADLDLNRVEFLRGEDEKAEFPKRYANHPEVAPEPAPRAFWSPDRGALYDPAPVRVRGRLRC